MRRLAPWLVVLALGCRSSERPEAEAAHWLPAPRRASQAAPSPARIALERGCGECHTAQAHDWSSSQHASAWSSAAFQRAFEREPLAFCRNCHAPEGDALADVGVGCVSCHVEPGEARIWTAGATFEPGRAVGCALPVARSPAFAGSSACAGCHEFAFPDSPLRQEPLLMQSTIREHRESAAAAQACIDCHMPPARGHAFPGAYDVDMLRRALKIDARREGVEVVLSLQPGAVGHAVPTGDLFRRLEISLTTRDDEGREQLLARRWLGRRFGPGREGALSLTVELEDSRVGPGGAILRVRAPVGVQVRWRVTHQRVLHAGGDPRRATVEGELELAQGWI